MYNSYFDVTTREKGFQYYKSGKVTDIVQEKNKVYAIVTGKEMYGVEVTFNEQDDRIIESAKCDCPYYTERHINCKHIYATVLSVKYDEQREEMERLEELKQLQNKEEKRQEDQAKPAKPRKRKISFFRILGAIFGFIGGLIPEEEKEIEGLKVGDTVKVLPYGADGEITNIYYDNLDGRYKYNVLIEAEHEIDGDGEDEDVFERDELIKKTD